MGFGNIYIIISYAEILLLAFEQIREPGKPNDATQSDTSK